ncbi:MAG: DUF427 domain-containing protein [Pseudomonadota bacterium]
MSQGTGDLVRDSNPDRDDPASLSESVWDYPRPPRLERSVHPVRVMFAGKILADSRNAFRVLETSHPPTFYIHPADVNGSLLVPSKRRSWCEWKGRAVYWTLRAGDRESLDAGWSYPEPTAQFAAIRDHIAFYPGRVDACYVGDEQVHAQDGDFYGGWITSQIRGPFKGGPGTRGW